MWGKLASLVFGWKTAAIAGAALLAAGTIGGFMVRDAFCDAAALRVERESFLAQIGTLKNHIAATNKAHEADTIRLRQDAIVMGGIRGTWDEEVEPHVSAGDCWTDDDVARVRKLWWR